VAGAIFLYRIGSATLPNQQKAELGYQLVAEQKVAGAGGTETGDYQPFVLFHGDPVQFVEMANVTIVND
jgi:hypothetical protein